MKRDEKLKSLLLLLLLQLQQRFDEKNLFGHHLDSWTYSYLDQLKISSMAWGTETPQSSAIISCQIRQPSYSIFPGVPVTYIIANNNVASALSLDYLLDSQTQILIQLLSWKCKVHLLPSLVSSCLTFILFDS